MRLAIKFFSLPLIMVVLVSCNPTSENSAGLSQAKFASANGDPDYWLLTDPEADLYNYIRTTTTIDGRSKLLIYNHKRNAVLIYDTESRSLEKKIEYDFQGPNALNALFPGGAMEVINKDSILFYSLQQSLIYLSDYNGNIYKRTRVKNDSVGFGSLGLNSHLAVRKNKVWMQSLPNTIGEFQLDYKNRPNMFGSIDLTTGETREFLLDYPGVYKNKNHSQQLKMARILYNETSDKFIISFPLSHEIYVTDFKGNTRTYTAQSDLVGKPVEMDEKRADIGRSALANHYYWINDSYGEFFHDPVSGYYFREAQKGISEASLANRDFETEKEIIVLNKDFKVVSKIPHHGGTLMYHFFKGSSIFWNANFDQYNFERENEDTIYFEKRSF